MTYRVAIAALLCLAGWAADVHIQSSDGEVVTRGRDEARQFVDMTFPLNPPAILQYVTRRFLDTGKFSPHPHTHLGFRNWGHMTYIYPQYAHQYNQWGKPDCAWTNTRPDGSTVTAITVPVVDPAADNARVADYTVRIVQLPTFPEWLFLRTSFHGAMPVRTCYVFAGVWTAFHASSHHPGANRYAYVAGKHYRSYGLEKIPPDLDFDGLAVYAVDSIELDNDLNVLVFDPARLSRRKLDFYYWVKGFSLEVMPQPDTPELTVACGRYDTENPAADAEAFFARGKDQAVRAALAGVDWDPHLDPAAEAKALARARESLRLIGDPAREQDVSNLAATLEQTAQDHDYEGYFKAFQSLHALNRKLTEASLDHMLD